MLVREQVKAVKLYSSEAAFLSLIDCTLPSIIECGKWYVYWCPNQEAMLEASETFYTFNCQDVLKWWQPSEDCFVSRDVPTWYTGSAFFLLYQYCLYNFWSCVWSSQSREPQSAQQPAVSTNYMSMGTTKWCKKGYTAKQNIGLSVFQQYFSGASCL